MSAPDGLTTTADEDAAWLERELGGLVNLDLGVEERRFVRFRFLDQLGWFERKAPLYQKRYYALRMVAVVGGVVVPALVSLNLQKSDLRDAVSYVTVVVSLLVAIALAIEGFFHFGDRWRQYRRTAELMKSEGWQFYERAGQYEQFPTHADAFRLFAARVEGLLAADVEAYVTRVMRDGPPGSGTEAAPKSEG